MTAALEGGEWSAARSGRSLPPGKTRCTFYRRLGRPQDRSGRGENLVPTGIWCRNVQPIVSRFTDWATQPTLYLVTDCFWNTKLLVFRWTSPLTEHPFLVFLSTVIQHTRSYPPCLVAFLSNLYDLFTVEWTWTTINTTAYSCNSAWLIDVNCDDPPERTFFSKQTPENSPTFSTFNTQDSTSAWTYVSILRHGVSWHGMPSERE